GMQPGPARLDWVVRWVDSFGWQHYYYGNSFQVGIDPTSIPLTVAANPSSGQAPLDVALTVNTSDPNSKPLQVYIDYGDSSPTVTRTVTFPYDPLILSHRYGNPGTYQAFVSVSNDAGGYAAQTTPV